MSEILVVANRTIGGRPLLDKVREAAAGGDTQFRLVIPMTKPAAGLVIYDDAVHDAAQVRVDLALSYLEQEGIKATGEVGDPDPFYAAMDAIAEKRPDEIFVSTHPATSSGWLRRDLIERIQEASGIPIQHVIVDIESDGFPFKSTLVVANKTSGGEELLEHLKHKAGHDGAHLFIIVLPLADGQGRATREGRARLARVLDRLRADGLLAAGMIGDPDPYTATTNALELFTVSDVVISTLPAERSGWMRSDLIERVKRSSRVPVEHVVVEMEPAPARAG